jgi:hypothetical protein
MTAQDPTSGMLSVEDIATAARTAGVSLDDLDLALATLFLESEGQAETPYARLLREQSEREVEAAEARAARLQGPHIQLG